jgi:glycosyltransferase involved in cell wall biosynthesis
VSTLDEPMTPPHVCFVGLGNLPALAPEFSAQAMGGAELQQALLARALARRGWPVSMIVADCGQPDGASWHGIRTFKAYRPREGIPGVRFLHPRWTKLQRALRRANADIYYTSCAGAQLAQVVWFAHRRGRKVIFRIASNSDCDPRKLLVQYRRDRLLYRLGLAHVDLVLAQTGQQQRSLRENYRRNSRVAPSLIEPPGRCRGLRERDLEVLWVGNIRPVKRPELLLEVARRLPSMRFHMVGGPMAGAERLYESSRLEAASLANVTFRGALPYPEVRALYERARILLGTSEVEGFPNAYLQAWAHGTPVVAFLDPEGMLQRLKLGRAVRTVEEMCAALTELGRDEGRWEEASARARQYMELRWQEASVLAPYLTALAELAGRSPPRGLSTPIARSVLMVGTDLAGRGGIRTVVRGYIEAGLFDRIECTYITTHRFGSPWRKMSAALSGGIQASLRLRTLDAPLVHIHISFGASFWRKSVICLLARLAGRPYLLHVHGDLGEFYDNCSPLARRLVRDILAKAVLVITVCEAWRATLARICPQAHAEVLTNAVSLPPLDDLRRVEDRPPTLLFLGDVIRSKGVYDLARAFARIAGRFPRLRLVYAGAGEIEEMRRLAARLALEDRIECTGWLDAERKRAQLARATLFVLPSHVEGMPMSLLEAMAWGLPAIATAVGGVPEVIDPEVNGVLVPAGNIEALAGAITRLLNEPSLRDRLGHAARETIATRFPLAATLERLIGIYRRFGIEPRAAPAAEAAPLRAAAGRR